MITRKQRRVDIGLETLDERIVPAAGGAAHQAAAAQVQQLAAPLNFGNLVSALNNITVQIDNFNALNNVLNNSDIRVINVSDLLNGNNINALNNALNRNTVLQDFLNNSGNNNTILRDFLNNNDVAIGQVVGLNVNVLSGQVTVFHI